MTANGLKLLDEALSSQCTTSESRRVNGRVGLIPEYILHPRILVGGYLRRQNVPHSSTFVSNCSSPSVGGISDSIKDTWLRDLKH